MSGLAKHLVFVALLFIGLNASSNTIYVNLTAPGAENGTSWNDAWYTLYDALDDAEPGDEIWIAEGFFTDFGSSSQSFAIDIPDQVKIYGGFAGTETHPDQRDIENHPTIISGNTDGTIDVSDDKYQLIRVEGKIGVLLDGLIFENAYSPNNFGPEFRGALYLENSLVDVNHCEFRNNTAFGGSAISMLFSEVEIRNSLFHHNNSTLPLITNYTNSGSIAMAGCTIADNTISGANQPVIAGSGDWDCQVVNCIIWQPELDQVFSSSMTVAVLTSIFSSDVNIDEDFGLELYLGDPRFVDPENSNYRIDVSSFAYNNGFPISPLSLIDLAGQPRVVETVDMGCYETSSCSVGNDSYTNAYELEIDGDPIFGSNQCATQDQLQYSACDQGFVFPTVRTVWYKFIAPSTGHVRIEATYLETTTVGFSVELGLSRLSFTPGFIVPLDCSNDNNGLDEVYTNSNLIPGECYYLSVSGPNSSMGTFNLSASEEPLVGDGSRIFVNDDATGNGNGTSWTNAHNTLQEALEFAQPGSEVWVAEGTYYPEEVNGGIGIPDAVSVFGGFNGSEIFKSERNPLVNETIVSGNLGNQNSIADNAKRLIQFLGGPLQNSLLDGFVLEDANCIDNVMIASTNLNPRISNCVLRSNIFGGYGSLVTASPDDRVMVDNCLIVDNVFSGTSRMFTAFENANLEVVNCTITENEVSNFAQIYEGGLLLLNSIVYNNVMDPIDLDIDEGLITSNCIIEEFTNALPGTAVLFLDPFFINPAQGNFRLGQNSPAINSGNNGGAISDYDLDNTTRVNQGVIDIGAFESAYLLDDYGCLDASACNYDNTAIFTNFSCYYPGCNNESASNYNPFTLCDDESLCVFNNTCIGDLNGDATVDSTDLIVFLSFYGEVCQGPCPADLDNSGSVDSGDLIAFLATYGENCD